MHDDKNNEDDNELSPEELEIIEQEHDTHIAYQTAYLFQSVTNNYNNLRSLESSYPPELYLSIMETISDAQNDILSQEIWCDCDECNSENQATTGRKTCDDCKQKIDNTLNKLDFRNKPSDNGTNPDNKV